jgi:hypothetical protein
LCSEILQPLPPHSYDGKGLDVLVLLPSCHQPIPEETLASSRKENVQTSIRITKAKEGRT